MRISPLLAAGAAWLCPIALPALAQAQADMAAPPQNAQAMLDRLRETSGVPGLSAAVWQDGDIRWTGQAGLRDLEHGLPIDARTRFRLASVSKLFVVTALAQLAQEGKVDLDAPVSVYLPWLDNDWPPISARDLAAHASGLPHYQEVDGDRGGVHYASQREAVSIFSQRPLLSPPTSEYAYSSWGYTLLGALVEEVSGLALGDYISRHVAPGLDIGLDATGSGQPDVSSAYQFDNGQAVQAPPHDFSYTWGGGGLMGSAPDIARFGGALMAGQSVQPATMAAMLEPYRLQGGQLAGDDNYVVGFGWRSGKDSDGNDIAFHNGSALGARSSLLLWRQEGVAAAVLTNISWTSSIDRTAEMLAAPFRPAAAGLVPTGCPTSALRYQGMFGEVAVSGDARFAMREGRCEGVLALDQPMADYFARGPQPASGEVHIVGIDPSGGLSRAGLVTGYGIYDLRAGLEGEFTSPMSASRTFSFRLVRDGQAR